MMHARNTLYVLLISAALTSWCYSPCKASLPAREKAGLSVRLVRTGSRFL